MKKIFATMLSAVVCASAMAVCASAETVEPTEVLDEEAVVTIADTDTFDENEGIEGIGGDVDTDDVADADADADAEVTDTEVDTEGTETGTEDDKGSPDTGVAGVAAVAGVAIVAGGVLVLTKKKD